MSRGPKPRRALNAAIPVAELRGKVQIAGSCPESQYDFTIVSAIPVAFIRVKFAARILIPLEEIASEYRVAILELMAVTRDTAISRELWLCSKHRTLRFFRILSEGLVELGRDGKVLVG
jgi:hypothetical protein